VVDVIRGLENLDPDGVAELGALLSDPDKRSLVDGQTLPRVAHQGRTRKRSLSIDEDRAPWVATITLKGDLEAFECQLAQGTPLSPVVKPGGPM
jgi:hypothetical protein